MSNYSFMKSGFNLVEEGVGNEQVKQIQALVMSFMDKALHDIAIYVEHCGREEITPQDIKLGLKSETFKFMQRPDALQNIEKWKEYLDEETSDSESEEEMVVNAPSTEPYDLVKCRTICESMKSVEKKWKEWIPNEGIEMILKNAIDKI